jgi:hypothetical protein
MPVPSPPPHLAQLPSSRLLPISYGGHHTALSPSCASLRASSRTCCKLLPWLQELTSRGDGEEALHIGGDGSLARRGGKLAHGLVGVPALLEGGPSGSRAEEVWFTRSCEEAGRENTEERVLRSLLSFLRASFRCMLERLQCHSYPYFLLAGVRLLKTVLVPICLCF